MTIQHADTGTDWGVTVSGEGRVLAHYPARSLAGALEMRRTARTCFPDRPAQLTVPKRYRWLLTRLPRRWWQ